MTITDYQKLTAWLEEQLRKTSAKSQKYQEILREVQYTEYRLALLVQRRKEIVRAVDAALAAQREHV